MNADKFKQDVSDIFNHTSAPLTLDFGCATHQGLVRENNEDSYLLMRFGRSLEKLATNLDQQLLGQNYSLTCYGMLVADGLGGMAAGEVASSLALSKLIELVLETSYWFLAIKLNREFKTILMLMTLRFFLSDMYLTAEEYSEDKFTGS